MSRPLPSVLITGASKGIGRATARYLAQNGFRVFAGVRNPRDRESIAEEHPGSITPVVLDVADSDSIKNAVLEVKNSVGEGGLAGLVNNAGMVVAGPLEGLPIEDLRRQFDVNVFGPIEVIQHALPLIRKGKGRIVNMSSINGRIAVPFVAPYAASKFALEAFSDGLRMELRRQGIPVVVIQPGAIDTPIWETAGKTVLEILDRMQDEAKERYSGILKRIHERAKVPSHAISPDHVARVVLRALTVRRPKTRYLVGRDAKFFALLAATFPDRLLDRVRTG
ncbi:MAG: SDR family oxidoreductase [Gemmatimonadota bacterium]|nr:SDR family oxidoreductase [Gemmatimonadota bacterium]